MYLRHAAQSVEVELDRCALHVTWYDSSGYRFFSGGSGGRATSGAQSAVACAQRYCTSETSQGTPVDC